MEQPPSEQTAFYCFDVTDPMAYTKHPNLSRPRIATAHDSNWHEKMYEPSHENKLVYKFEKSIPQVV